MKRAVCMLCFTALLLVLLPACAEVVWQEWAELEPGIWHREGAIPQDEVTAYEEFADGMKADELITTEQLIKGYGDNGLLIYTSRMVFDANGAALSHANYNYDETGTLALGALTTLKQDGTPDRVWACSVQKTAEGGLRTQVELFDAADTLLSRTHAVYAHDGSFLSGEVFDPISQTTKALTYAPADDPIRVEWLKGIR